MLYHCIIDENKIKGRVPSLNNDYGIHSINLEPSFIYYELKQNYLSYLDYLLIRGEALDNQELKQWVADPAAVLGLGLWVLTVILTLTSEAPPF